MQVLHLQEWKMAVVFHGVRWRGPVAALGNSHHVATKYPGSSEHRSDVDVILGVVQADAGKAAVEVWFHDVSVCVFFHCFGKTGMMDWRFRFFLRGPVRKSLLCSCRRSWRAFA